MTFDQICEIYDNRDYLKRLEMQEVWASLERTFEYDPTIYVNRQLWRDSIADRVARRMALGEYAPFIAVEYEDVLKAQEYEDVLKAQETYHKVQELMKEIEQ